jgi:hypothetical protein
MVEEREPSKRQIDFATAIAETIGEDLPDEFTSSAYHKFINENVDYFYEVQNDIRYKRKWNEPMFHLEHSYIIDSGYCGDTELNINPLTR